VSNTDGTDSDFTELEPHIAGLLQAAGMESSYRILPVEGGRNSRVYQIDATKQAALKWYHSHPSDRRDRLDSEYTFSQFCWVNGIVSVPEPLAVDRVHRLALYQWLDGRRLTADELVRPHVDAALQFVLELSRHRTSEQAARLSAAAEACFSIADHLSCVAGRVARLDEINATSDICRQVLEFVGQRLDPAWRQVAGSIAGDSDVSRMLGDGDRCLSPSDLGFHNVLLAPDDTLYFLDFEYAGWDDPAKLVCDFFCQVEVPVPTEYWDSVIETLADLTRDRRRFRTRCERLLPVYRVKWACIVLNEFLPDHAARRRFSTSAQPTENDLLEQLQKAEQLLAAV
jgi:hypothetical protein